MSSFAKPHIEQTVHRKLNRRLLPFLVILYMVAYLDRVNIGFAKLTMATELGFSEQVYGLGAGIFFLGYFLFEIPSNLILQRVGAKMWIARIMIVWGLISMVMLQVQTPLQFYLLRFCLGVGEAGFFPGIILYLTYWYPARWRAKATAAFMTAVALAGVIGGPVSGLIMNDLQGIAGLAGWQWLFLLEGMPAVLLGITVAFRLDNDPGKAAWLSCEEKTWLQQELTHEANSKTSTMHNSKLREAFANRQIWCLCLIYFSLVMGLYGISFWLPQIVHDLGQQNLWHTGLLTAIPYLVATVGMMIIGYYSDQRNERVLHVFACAILGGIGLICSGIYVHSAVLALTALSLATLGIFSALPIFWSIPTALLRGTAAAGGIALINSWGNLAGYLSPVLVSWFKGTTSEIGSALYMLAFWLVLGGVAILKFRHTKLYMEFGKENTG